MGYGATKDWFKLVATGISLQGGSNSPKYNVDASVEDSNGDFACRTKKDTETEFSASYKITAGGDTNNQHALDDLTKIGLVVVFDSSTSIQVTGLDLKTDNKGYPVLDVKGVKETAAQSHATFSSGVTFLAKKKAQAFGIASITGKVISGSVSISGGLATAQDSQGITVKREPEGVRLTTSNSLQACTGLPAAVADTTGGYKIETPLASDESNTGYGTSTIAAYKDIARDT